MRIISTRENLVYGLDVVNAFASKHTNLPVLQNILIRAHESGVEISATNLEVGIKTHLRAKVEEQGSFTVPAKTITDYIRLLTSDQVELFLEGNELTVKAGTSETKIKGTPAEDFPVIPEIDGEHEYAIKADTFRNAISHVVISCAKNEIRPEFSGVYCSFFSERYQGLLMAATDSYRLSEVRLPVAQGSDPGVTCIIPGRVMYEISRLIALGKQHDGEENIRFSVSQNQVGIRYDSFEMTSRLIDGRYPDYTQIIPEQFKTEAYFSVSDMVNKIKAASLFSSVGINAVSVSIDVEKKLVGVSSTSAQTGEHVSSIDADVQGDNVTVLLNHRYVLDGLNQIGSEDVELKMNGADAPCLLKTRGSDDFLYIVMPIRQ